MNYNHATIVLTWASLGRQFFKSWAAATKSWIAPSFTCWKNTLCCSTVCLVSMCFSLARLSAWFSQSVTDSLFLKYFSQHLNASASFYNIIQMKFAWVKLDLAVKVGVCLLLTCSHWLASCVIFVKRSFISLMLSDTCGGDGPPLWSTFFTILWWTLFLLSNIDLNKKFLFLLHKYKQVLKMNSENRNRVFINVPYYF